MIMTFYEQIWFKKTSTFQISHLFAHTIQEMKFYREKAVFLKILN